MSNTETLERHGKTRPKKVSKKKGRMVGRVFCFNSGAFSEFLVVVTMIADGEKGGEEKSSLDSRRNI